MHVQGIHHHLYLMSQKLINKKAKIEKIEKKNCAKESTQPRKSPASKVAQI